MEVCWRCFDGSLRVETVGGLVFHVNRSCWRDMVGDVLGCEVLLLCLVVGSVTTSFASLEGRGTVVHGNRPSDSEMADKADMF